jgi:hypothetical protein
MPGTYLGNEKVDDNSRNHAQPRKDEEHAPLQILECQSARRREGDEAGHHGEYCQPDSFGANGRRQDFRRPNDGRAIRKLEDHNLRQQPCQNWGQQDSKESELT